MGAPLGNKNHLGHKHSLASRKQMSATKKGKHYSPTTEFKKGQTAPTKGKKRPALYGNINGFKKGQTPWNKGLGTKSSLNALARKTLEARLWRIAVFERDDYTCQDCGIRGNKLNAHHIKPFSIHPELRFAIDNGQTLCESCHRKTDTYGVRPHNRSGVSSMSKLHNKAGAE